MMGKILINVLYTGTYISDTNKIGHEIINMFKDDLGRNYIYVTPYGNIADVHDNQIDAVVMVRSIGDKCVEIIAKAEMLEQVAFSRDNDVSASQRNYIERENVRYCGKSLTEIMKVANQDNEKILITFKSGKVRKPSKQLIICPDKADTRDAVVLPGITAINNMSMKLYLSETEKSEAYFTVKSILDNAEYWEKEDTIQSIDISSIGQRDSRGFLNVIGKTNDELAFSNMFAYFFMEYPEIFVKFAEEVLGLAVAGNFTLAREENNIDILISDEKNYIVIENKVKSKINGIRHDINGDMIVSQLKKYHDYAISKAGERKASFYLFSPDYNYIDTGKFERGKEYRIITYSAIYGFFARNGQLAMYSRYYHELLIALKLHTKQVSNDLSDVLEQRFVRVIRRLGI